jgi:hypothetical protein
LGNLCHTRTEGVGRKRKILDTHLVVVVFSFLLFDDDVWCCLIIADVGYNCVRLCVCAWCLSRLDQVPSAGGVDGVVGGDHHLVTEIEDLVREKMVRFWFFSPVVFQQTFFLLVVSSKRFVLVWHPFRSFFAAWPFLNFKLNLVISNWMKRNYMDEWLPFLNEESFAQRFSFLMLHSPTE